MQHEKSKTNFQQYSSPMTHTLQEIIEEHSLFDYLQFTGVLPTAASYN